MRENFIELINWVLIDFTHNVYYLTCDIFDLFPFECPFKLKFAFMYVSLAFSALFEIWVWIFHNTTIVPTFFLDMKVLWDIYIINQDIQWVAVIYGSTTLLFLIVICEIYSSYFIRFTGDKFTVDYTFFNKVISFKNFSTNKIKNIFKKFFKFFK